MPEAVPHHRKFTISRHIEKDVYLGYQNDRPQVKRAIKIYTTWQTDFKREKAVRRILQDHPPGGINIAPMESFELIGDEKVACFYKFIEGKKLMTAFVKAEIENKRGFKHSLFPLTTITAFLLQLSQGIDFLHGVSIGHGDLHDENVMVTKPGRKTSQFFMIDFGFSVSGKQFDLDVIQADRKQFAAHVSRMLLSGVREAPHGQGAYYNYNYDPHFNLVGEKYGQRSETALRQLATETNGALPKQADKLLDDLVSKNPGFMVSNYAPSRQKRA